MARLALWCDMTRDWLEEQDEGSVVRDERLKFQIETAIEIKP